MESFGRNLWSVDMLVTNLILSLACSLNCAAGSAPSGKYMPLQIRSANSLKFQHFLAQTRPESAELFYELGVSEHQANQFEAAIEAYQQAVRLNPQFDAAYINLGLAYIQLSQFDPAREVFQRVLRLPDRPEDPASIHAIAHYNLAIILNRQGQPDEALQEVQAALAITPDFGVAQQLLHQLQQTPSPAPAP